MDGDRDLDILNFFHAAIPRIQWYENRINERRIPVRHFIEDPILANEITDISECIPVDLNGDQEMDVIVMGTKLALMQNRGKTNPWGVIVIHPDLSRARGIQLADVDGDGDFDVTFAGRTAGGDSNQGVMWFENQDGQGTFGPLQVIAIDKHTMQPLGQPPSHFTLAAG